MPPPPRGLAAAAAPAGPAPTAGPAGDGPDPITVPRRGGQANGPAHPPRSQRAAARRASGTAGRRRTAAGSSSNLDDDDDFERFLSGETDRDATIRIGKPS